MYSLASECVSVSLSLSVSFNIFAVPYCIHLSKSSLPTFTPSISFPSVCSNSTQTK